VSALQDAEPALASFLYSSILGQPNLERSVSFLLANKLASSTMLGTQLMRLIQDAYEDDEVSACVSVPASPQCTRASTLLPTLSRTGRQQALCHPAPSARHDCVSLTPPVPSPPQDIMASCSADIQAVLDRDPACDKYTQCLLYFKGFQAVQSHRIAHWLWRKGRKVRPPPPLLQRIEWRTACMILHAGTGFLGVALCQLTRRASTETCRAQQRHLAFFTGLHSLAQCT
jgi:hypothetical protein